MLRNNNNNNNSNKNNKTNNSKKTAITITARMKSTRLLLKIMRYLNGSPLIERMIDKLKQARHADMIIMCTSTNPQDDILIDVAEKKGILWYRGSEDDVLERIKEGAMKYEADFVVSVTADNPLTDPEYIDRIIESYKKEGGDYIYVEDLPIGTNSHGVTTEALKKVCSLKKETDTEIWGLYFKDTNMFNIKKINVDDKDFGKNYRLTVDHPEDLTLMREIYQRFSSKEKFSIGEIIAFLKANPTIAQINQKHQQLLSKEIDYSNFKSKK